MQAIETTRQERTRDGQAAPTAKELHEALLGPPWQLQTSLAAVKKAISLLSAIWPMRACPSLENRSSRCSQNVCMERSSEHDLSSPGSVFE